MSFWTDLRSLAYLKRIAAAEERQAAALERLAQLAEDEWSRRHVKPPRGHVEFGLLDVDEAQRRWERQQEAQEAGRDFDEDL